MGIFPRRLNRQQKMVFPWFKWLEKIPSGAKAHVYFQILTARLKACPDAQLGQFNICVSFPAGSTQRVPRQALSKRCPIRTLPLPAAAWPAGEFRVYWRFGKLPVA